MYWKWAENDCGDVFLYVYLGNLGKSQIIKKNTELGTIQNCVCMFYYVLLMVGSVCALGNAIVQGNIIKI